MLKSWIVFLDGQKTTPLKTGCIPDEIRSAKVKGVYGSGLQRAELQMAL